MNSMAVMGGLVSIVAMIVILIWIIKSRREYKYYKKKIMEEPEMPRPRKVALQQASPEPENAPPGPPLPEQDEGMQYGMVGAITQIAQDTTNKTLYQVIVTLKSDNPPQIGACEVYQNNG